MAQISNKTLEYISGEYGVNTSTKLLDNTIATMTHKMNQKSQKQLGDIRNMQIKQAMAEQAEYEKNAYNRDLDRRLLTKRNEHAVKNAERDLEMADQQKRFEYIGAKEEAFNNMMDRVMSAPDNATQNKYLLEFGDDLPPEIVQELGEGNWDDPTFRRKQQESWSTNSEYIRSSMLQREKAMYDAASAGSKRKPTYSNNPALIKSYLHESIGVGGENVAAGIATASVEMKDQLINEGYPGMMPTVIAEKAAQKYNNDKEKYQIAGKWINDDKIDLTKLMSDVYADITGRGASSGDVENKKPWRDLNVSDADWEAAREDPLNEPYSDEELLKAFAASRGYE